MDTERNNASSNLIELYNSEELKWTDEDKILMDYAVSMFDSHAKQRLDAFRSYLIITAVIFASFTAMWREGQFGACIVLAISNIAVIFSFYAFDKRVLQLVHHAEDILKIIEAKLANAARWRNEDKAKIQYFTRNDKEKKYLPVAGFQVKTFPITYRWVFYTLFSLMLIVSIVGMVTAIMNII